MAMIKTTEEIAAMREGGALLAMALQKVVEAVKPGVTMRTLDDIARDFLENNGAKPSFLGYAPRGSQPFPATLCVSKNNEVVHGLGNRNIKLQEGDIVGLDIGCWYKGLCTDMAVTVPVGQIKEDKLQLLQATHKALFSGVQVAVPGKTVNDISAAIESAVDQQRYGIVRSLVGHGVGHAVHESPNVPNYVDRTFPKIALKSGMCLAVEPMLTLGTDEVNVDKDGWTIKTEDHSWAAHFEVTIAILDDGYEVLTPLPKLSFI